ncbi:MAG: hypothetical protein FWE20_09945 [Defluviitaleaceae bacterium]|nr:hypothetical protein [Defluviitaleaceae bacterium]
MAFFEDELRKIFGASPAINDARFTGRACMGRLGETTNVKLEFVTLGTHEKYEGIKASVFNRNEGVIDSNVFRFMDMLDFKPGGSIRVSPHIWVYNGKAEWYSYKPNAADYAAIAASINSYLEVFLEPARLTRETEKAATGHSGEYTSVMNAIRQDKEKGSNKPYPKTEGANKGKFYAVLYNPRCSLSPDACMEYEVQSFPDKKSRDAFVSKNQNLEGYLGKSHAVSLRANDEMVKEWESKQPKRSDRDAR